MMLTLGSSPPLLTPTTAYRFILLRAPNSKIDTTWTRKNPDSRKRGVYLPHRTGAGGQPGAVDPPGYYAPRDRTLGPFQAPRHSTHLSTPDHGGASRSSFLRTG